MKQIFIKAIIESNQQDIDLLVFADWLEENNEGETAKALRWMVENNKRPAIQWIRCNINDLLNLRFIWVLEKTNRISKLKAIWSRGTDQDLHNWINLRIRDYEIAGTIIDHAELCELHPQAVLPFQQEDYIRHFTTWEDSVLWLAKKLN